MKFGEETCGPECTEKLAGHRQQTKRRMLFVYAALGVAVLLMVYSAVTGGA